MKNGDLDSRAPTVVINHNCAEWLGWICFSCWRWAVGYGWGLLLKSDYREYGSPATSLMTVCAHNDRCCFFGEWIPQRFESGPARCTVSRFDTKVRQNLRSDLNRLKRQFINCTWCFMETTNFDFEIYFIQMTFFNNSDKNWTNIKNKNTNEC